jgi:hypothetical protein
VAQQQLNRSKVKSSSKPPACRLVPEVVPVQIDFGEMFAVHATVRPRQHAREFREELS